MGRTVTRVLVAEDHPHFRRDLCTDLEEAGFDVCAEAADAATAVAAAVAQEPELCLLDVRMPGCGLVAAWEITEALPAAKVVMLTVSRDGEDVLAAIRAGARAYLSKDLDPDRLPQVLREVLDGAVVIPWSLARRLRAALEAGRRLTESESSLLDRLVGGASDEDAAAAAGIDPSVLREAVLELLRKARAPRAEAVLARSR